MIDKWTLGHALFALMVFPGNYVFLYMLRGGRTLLKKIFTREQRGIMRAMAFGSELIYIKEAALWVGFWTAIIANLTVEITQETQNIRDPQSFFDPLDLAIGWVATIAVFLIVYTKKRYYE